MKKNSLSSGKRVTRLLVGGVIVIVAVVGIGLYLNRQATEDGVLVPAPDASRHKIASKQPEPSGQKASDPPAAEADSSTAPGPTSAADGSMPQGVIEGQTVSESSPTGNLLPAAPAAPPQAATLDPGGQTPAEPKAAETKLSPPEPKRSVPSPYYAIQIGAFQSKANADRKADDMRRAGYDVYLVEIRSEPSRALHGVRFGRWADKARASAALVEFKQKQNLPAILILSNED